MQLLERSDFNKIKYHILHISQEENKIYHIAFFE